MSEKVEYVCPSCGRRTEARLGLEMTCHGLSGTMGHPMTIMVPVEESEESDAPA